MITWKDLVVTNIINGSVIKNGSSSYEKTLTLLGTDGPLLAEILTRGKANTSILVTSESKLKNNLYSWHSQR